MKVFLPPSRATGLERLSKHPKSTTYGRQNPILARWNSEEQLVAWRGAWAETVNRYLEKARQPDRIDHRSFADQGIDLTPTIHEGVAARVLEKKGVVSDRCELNREIRKDNALIRMLKEALATVKDAVQVFDEKLEAIHGMLVATLYGERQTMAMHAYYWDRFCTDRDRLDRLEDLLPELKAKTAEQKQVHKELGATGKIHFKKRKELGERDAVLIEEVNGLQHERSALVAELGLADEKEIPAKRASLPPLEEEADRQYGLSLDYSARHTQAKQEYDAVLDESVEQSVDQEALWKRQLSLRSSGMSRLRDRLKAEYKDTFSGSRFQAAEADIHHYTQVRHYAFSDYARELQRKAHRQERNDTNRSGRKRSCEPER